MTDLELFVKELVADVTKVTDAHLDKVMRSFDALINMTTAVADICTVNQYDSYEVRIVKHKVLDTLSKAINHIKQELNK